MNINKVVQVSILFLVFIPFLFSTGCTTKPEVETVINGDKESHPEQTQEESTPSETPIESKTQETTAKSSDTTDNPSEYDDQIIEVSGQTYLSGSPPKLLVDGKSGINIVGDTGNLGKGFYSLTGEYDADSNTLDVTSAIKKDVEYLTSEAGKALGIDLAPVSVHGLIATTPKEIADALTSYLSIPNFPEDIPIYPYVVYSKAGLYLALSDTLVHLPADISLFYDGKDYSFTFSAGELKGTLVQTPLDDIDLGTEWQPDEFKGIIIVESIRASDPVSTTVRQISDDPASFAFQRVSIGGTYLVATGTIDYSDIKMPFGAGILSDNPEELFFKEEGPRLETLDPERKVWQLRQGQVIGTVLYPTEEILKYLDYSAPLSGQEVRERIKPALLVDTLVEDVAEVAEISDINPVSGNPGEYWDKIAKFDGYALGVNIPLKEVVKAIAQTDIPVNVNLLAIGIADSPTIGSQLAIIGLNNELIDGGETILGRFDFKVAITEMPINPVGIDSADTAFFLLTKEELPIEIPVDVPEDVTIDTYTLGVSILPSGSGMVNPPGGEFASGSQILVTATPAPGYVFDHWEGDISGTSSSITITMSNDKVVSAHFKEMQPEVYNLIISVDPAGKGTVATTPPGGSHPAGTVVTLTAAPSPGYKFDHWSGDVTGTSSTVTITVDKNISVTAHFKSIF
jgi:uncharacterized repeat protein (TIGR02543 family)